MQSIKAFTMLELVMVVVIIGMIAMFSIPNYTKAVTKSYVKAGSNNLLIMYAAQNIKKLSGANYQACADTGTCNANLTLSVVENGLTYSCTIDAATPPTTFTCQAAQAGGFTLQISNGNNVVCCKTGTCYGPPGC